ncbi:MAG: DUF1640 domain-containing protein [Magnetococcales bacterium]|nr:DUF1640 domain-containing protein [Magnetococcales bacterium]
MSTTIAFDTHAYVKKLRDAGVDERQAEIQAEALVSMVEDRLATKQDMNALKRDLADIRKEMVTIEANLKRDLADVESSLRKDMATIEANLKRDIKELDVKAENRAKELDVKIETSKLELRKDIESAKVDTIKWTAGMFVAQTALIIGALFAVMKMNQPNLQPTGYYTPPVQEMRLPTPPTPAQPVVPLSR